MTNSTALSLLAAEHAEGTSGLFVGDLAAFIWTILIFGLVLVVLGKFAWRPLLLNLQRREKFIHESLTAAKRDREAAETRLKEYEQRLSKAREEATGLVEEGRRDAEAVKRRIEEETRKSAEDLINRARREIGIARDTALRDLYEQSAQLAIQMAGEVLKRQTSPEDHQRLIEDALNQLQTKRIGRN